MDVEPVEPAFHEVGPTAIPTLVFGAEYDPITPPAGSEGTARRLGAEATYVFVPGVGHGATRSNPCPQAVFFAFLDDPTGDLDTSCVEAMGGPAWVV